mmetsp:Transcript_28079/g.47474  ORF Transcript_28079/g.47474 Transcript_28079/m.47474 type:complete len:171 (-) Transcript_28079:560-1072(-)
MSLLLLDEEALYLTINNKITVYQFPPSTATPSSAVYDVALSSSIAPFAVSAEELYTLFQRKYSKFPLKYKVYSYFRDQGCCVHTAVNYGLDYAIYQTLPSLCHSALSVLVVDGVTAEAASSAATDVGMEYGDESLRWTHVSAMTRVMGVSTCLNDCLALPGAFSSCAMSD